MPEKFIYFLYRSFLTFLTPVVLFYALIRMLRNGAYAGTLRERLGFLPEEMQQVRAGAIWIHAVSVGEVMAAGTLVRELRRSIEAPVFISTTTLSGYKAAKERLQGQVEGSFYAPADFAHAVRRVLRHIQPGMLIVLETEVWPNLFREAKRAGCGLMIANGRISDKAFPAYRKWRWFFRHVLRWPDCVLAQSETMRERYIAAGAPAERVMVAGNVKFDFEPKRVDPQSPVLRWLERGTGPVWIAASTTADAAIDEDSLVMEAFHKLDGWRMILAPRKPERFARVAEMLAERSIPFWRRSAPDSPGSARVLLLDTIGELATLFPLASVVFMGGTLTETEGHNFLEPAFAAKPVIVGPRLGNFREIANDFLVHRALISIGDGAELANAVVQAWHEASTNGGTGDRGYARAEAHRGAARRTSEVAREVYGASLFCRSRSFPLRALLRPLTLLWGWGARYRAQQEWKRRRPIETPVISVGNITVGGTGKTPFVMHLARRLRERALEPVVLTRGYGRVSNRKQLMIERGRAVSILLTGDEAQMVLRAANAGLAIGADRFEAAAEAEQKLNPDIFLADDAFSHQRLARDVDIVLIDSLDPFGGCELMPLGRLREPIASLKRADLFVISRCERGWTTAQIENRLRQVNGHAPIFRSHLAPGLWVSWQGPETSAPPPHVVAFCGLGNPNTFWRTLDEIGVKPATRLSFDDHHQYSPTDLHRMVLHAEAIGAEALVTTEKDAVNLPDGFEVILKTIGLLWLQIDVEIDNEEELLRMISPDDIRRRRASGHPAAHARL